MESDSLKCPGCSETKERFEFLAKNDRICKTCKDCRKANLERIKLRKQLKLATTIVDDRTKMCENCEKFLDIDTFENEKGKPFKHCRTCRDKKAQQKKDTKLQNEALVSEGTKMCGICSHVRELEFFAGEDGETFSTCKRCRDIGVQTYKRERETKWEKYLDRKRDYRKKVRERSPLRIRRENSRSVAKQMGREHTLTNEQMDDLFLSSCQYCGEPGLGGIDRVDNAVGYIITNCVPCCTPCNWIKGQLQVEQFLTQAKSVATYQSTGQTSTDWPFVGSKRVDYKKYRRGAAERELEFVLTKEEFKSIIAPPCFYCGKRNGDGHQNGIDRKDNSVGYTVENCVSCCRPCNFMKRNRTVQEFIDQCQKIATHN